MKQQQQITHKLQEAFAPEHLDVINESHQHRTQPGAESHFRVVVITSQFESLSLIQRHRAIQEVLADELAGGIHALAIEAKTPQQWEAAGQNRRKSPPCASKRS